jgi:hypothetical protein
MTGNTCTTVDRDRSLVVDVSRERDVGRALAS